MTSHTPGPWTVTRGNLIRINGGGNCIAGVHKIGKLTGRLDDGEVMANAHLIAAAPSMYGMVDLIAGFTEPQGDDDDAEAMRSLIRSARMLRKMARGEQ